MTYVGFVVKGPDGKAIDPESELWSRVRKDLTRVKWVHYEVLELLSRHPGTHIGLTEIQLGLSHLVHQVLGPRARFEFTRERIRGSVEANLGSRPGSPSCSRAASIRGTPWTTRRSRRKPPN